MRSNNLLHPLSAAQIPTTDEAIQQYHTFGGHLTLNSPFGEDPLKVDESLVTERERRLKASIPDFSTIFQTLVNGDDTHFRNGLKLLIQLTDQLATLVPST